MQIINGKDNPCSPCLCPGAPCEQCMFGYISDHEKAKLLKEVLEKEQFTGIVDRYKFFHYRR